MGRYGDCLRTLPAHSLVSDGHYWGISTIATRMGVCRNTILAWDLKRGFLMYQRYRGPRVCSFTMR
jgi:hypothetical protein